MISTNLPAAIATDLRATLRTTIALTEAAAWSESRASRVLVLEGDTGSGKSLAAAWAWQFARRRTRPSESGKYAWPVWCDARLVAAMVGHEWRHEAAWSSFDCSALVVIDDVGIEDKPDQMCSLLERLYNVSSGRAILTTNLGFEDFSRRYGDRVRSRLVGAARWVRCADPDMRIAPPSSEPFRGPDVETPAELVARLKAEEQAAAEEREWEAGRAEREKFWAQEMAKLDGLTEAKRLPREIHDSDEMTRDFLRKQLERRLAEGDA